MRKLTTILLLLCAGFGRAQTLGGNAAYNFLHLPAQPLLTAAGGVNTSYLTNEVGLAANNPALLQPALHGQLALGFNAMPGGIKTYSTTGALHKEKLQTTFSGHIYFVDYGSIPQTDAAGNSSGNFRPVDFVVQVGAARQYLQNWTYGAQVKFIQSSYQQWTSSAVAMDLGLLYHDSAANFTAALLVKNMGVMLKPYTGQREDLPFDLQLGFTKRLARSPFGFSVTAQQLHRFNLAYDDTTFNRDNELSSGTGFFTKLFHHVVLASHIYIGTNLEATIGYNFLRRAELLAGDEGNGLTGFSLGLRVKFQKLQILYARSNYQNGIACNQLGVTLQLNKMFGLGE